MRLTTLSLVCLISLTTCIGCSTSPYWHFGCGQHGTVMVPALTQPTQTDVKIAPLGSGAMPISSPQSMPLGMPRMALETSIPSCTLDDLCVRMMRLERTISTGKRDLQPLPIPRGE